MTSASDDTMWKGGLADYASRLRAGEITALQTVEASLDRIHALDGKYQAFVHVADDQALAAAKAVDAQLADGQDHGPLMGVPVAVKDLFAVDGMPTRVGSTVDLSDLVGSEGPLVKSLKQAGAIILGKTRMIEFAAGGINTRHPAPWNPIDPDRHRSPGGSSSGSAVAVAAGYCPLAIGSDTGGSVRSPAALCGIFGFKSSPATFSLQGAFPLCRAMDSVGIFAQSARDALEAFRALTPNKATDASFTLDGLRFGIPHPDFLVGLTPEVEAAFDAAIRVLERAGAKFRALGWPTSSEIDQIAEIFSGLVARELYETLGADRILRFRADIDPLALDRMERARDMPEATLARLRDIQTQFVGLAVERLSGLTAILCPTTRVHPPYLDDLTSLQDALAFNAASLGLTRMANAFGLAACSIPFVSSDGALSTGIDVAGPEGTDMDVLTLATLIETAFQEARQP